MCRRSYTTNERRHDEEQQSIYLKDRADDKKGSLLKNVDEKVDTALRRPRSFRYTCGRWHRSKARQDVCVSMVHYYSYVHHHCIRTAKRPMVCGTSTLLPRKKNIRTGVTHLIFAPRTCFIQEGRHNFPCILNGGGRIEVIGVCPVTTDCIEAISSCDNNNNNSRCYRSSSGDNTAIKTL